MNIRPNNLQTTPVAVPDASHPEQRTSARTILISAIVALAVVGFIIWRIFFSVPATPVKPPPPVKVTEVTRQDIAIVEHTIGTVVANATVQVTARVQGELVKAFFTEGQTVHAGDLLFQIDPRPYKAALDSANASLASAKAKAERYARLLAQKAVAPQDADDARAAYLEAVATADMARLNLGYTQIRSPIDGKTGAILIQPGNQITASAGLPGTAAASNAAPSGTTLVVITQVKPVKISLSLPQADLPRIQQRALAGTLTAKIDDHGAGGAPLEATVDFVGNAVDNTTGTIELRATYANTDSRLVPGELVDVGVTLDSLKQVMTVPRDAVNLGPDSRFVWRIKDSKAELVPVKVLSDNGSVDAIEGKIKPGDKVVIDGQLRVLAGKPVKVLKAGAVTTPAAP